MWAEFKGVGRGPNPARAHGSTDTHALVRGSPRSSGKYKVKANTAMGINPVCNGADTAGCFRESRSVKVVM